MARGAKGASDAEFACCFSCMMDNKASSIQCILDNLSLFFDTWFRRITDSKRVRGTCEVILVSAGLWPRQLPRDRRSSGARKSHSGVLKGPEICFEVL